MQGKEKRNNMKDVDFITKISAETILYKLSIYLSEEEIFEFILKLANICLSENKLKELSKKIKEL